jgi:hypothetical protein
LPEGAKRAYLYIPILGYISSGFYDVKWRIFPRKENDQELACGIAEILHKSSGIDER